MSFEDMAAGPREMLTVNESGLYSLIFTSRKPEAKRFRKWVTNEVLPAIRQTGGYVGYSENDPDPIIVWSKLLGVRPSDVITKGFDIGYLTGGPINPSDYLAHSLRASHDPLAAPLRTAHRTTVMVPMIRSRRMSRWPIFEVRPSPGFLPVVCCRGTRPSQAVKSRPRLKVAIGGANASIAAAVIGPSPGMVRRRFAVSSSLEDRRNLVFKLGNLDIKAANMIEVSLARLAHERMERARVSHRSRQRVHLGKPVGGDNPMLREMAAQRIHQLGSLPHQKVTGAKHHGSRLLLFRLQRHKAHRRP
jgi:hypothetical protein